MTILETVSFFMVILGDLPIESFRFDDGFRFARVLKKDTRESYILLFLHWKC